MLRNIRRRAAGALRSRKTFKGSTRNINDNRLRLEPLEPRMMLAGVPAGAEHLMITELNYNPYDPARTVGTFDDKEAFEFIELQNLSNQTIDLTGVTISGSEVGDVSFDFTGQKITELAPNEYVVVVAHEAAFAARYEDAYGTDRVAGQWTGNLGDSGDVIAVRDAQGGLILGFEYRDQGNWPGRADGDGATAELNDPAAALSITNQASRTEWLRDDDHWHSSGEFGGSPGVGGRGQNDDIVINEVLTHTDFPLSDTIELYNTTDAPIDVGGWYLSDQADDDFYEKYRIPDGTIIPAQGYLTFDEYDFNYNGGWHPGRTGDGTPDELHDFALSSYNGDHVWLMEVYDTGGLGFVDHVSFGAAPNGESFGRWPNATGDLAPMSRFTPGEANSPPRVGPLIISELMYHPPDLGGTGRDESLEFIEIFNPTGQAINLNSSPTQELLQDWRIRGDVDFDFEVGETIGPRSTIVVVPFDPDVDTDDRSAFLNRYPGVSPSVLVGGYREWDDVNNDYDNLLSNSSETVRLENWDYPPEGETEPGRFDADGVTYDDDPPWQNADGNGYSLHRVETDSWGIEPSSWIADTPTPGVVANFAPFANDDFYSIEVGGTLSKNFEGVLNNDADPNSADTVTAQLATGPSHGTLTGNALGTDGSFTYTPNPGFHGIDTFTYQATDQHGLSREATVTIAVNTKAKAEDDEYTIAPGDTLTVDAAEGVLVNDTDIDNDNANFEARLEYTIGDPPLYGWLTLDADGGFTYKHNGGTETTDEFSYRVFDGYQLSGKADVTINIVSNRPPTADAQSVTIDEDTPTPVTLTGNDLDGDSLTYEVVSGPTHGVLSGSVPNLTYTPMAGYVGPDEFTFKVNDGTVDSAIATVTIDVIDTNDAPAADAQSVTADEDTTVDITLTGSDNDGDPLTYTVVSGPSHGTLSGTAPNLTYTPNANYNGQDQFTFKVNDGTVDSAVATVTLDVAAVNDGPTADAQSVTTDEDTPLGITLTGDDIDGDALSYIVSDPSHGTLSGTAPNLTYAPGADFNGQDSFTFKVNDGTIDSAEATVTIDVTAVNDQPTADAQSVTTDEDVPLDITLTGDDVDGDTLTYTVVSGPSHGTLSGTAPNLTYAPGADFSGQDSFTFKVNDGTVDSAEATVTIDITAINDAPVAADDTATTDEAQPINIDVLGNDTDSDSDMGQATVQIVQQPADGTAQVKSDGTIDYVPPSNVVGDQVFAFTYHVIDSDGAISNEATVEVTVFDVSLHAEADPSYVVDEDHTLNAPAPGVLGNDDPADSAHLVGDVLHGTLTLHQDGSFDYTPGPDFNGTDTFTYRAIDGLQGSNTATVTITVNSINDAPVVVNHEYTVVENETLSETAPGVLAGISDVDGDFIFTAKKLTDPLHGTLTFNADGSFLYVPTAGFDGTDSFTYRASDGEDDSNVATALITVEKANLNPPVAQDDLYTMDEQGVLDVDGPGVLGNDSDADGNPLTVNLVQDVAHGSLDLQPDGSFTYTPGLGFHGTDTFTYRADDGPNESNLATVSITVEKPLDSVDFRRITGLEPADGDHWYRFTSTRAGTVTALLADTTLGPNTKVMLYADLGDGQRQLLAEGDARVDYDVTFGGQSYLLQVTGLEAAADLVLANLVQFLPNSNDVLVFGTDGDDTFDVTLGGSASGLTVNDIQYTTGGKPDITILGGNGSDQITVTGTSNNEAAVLSPTLGNLAGLGYQVQWSGTTMATIYGGGGDDAAFLFDSAGDDQFIATPTYAAIKGDGFENVLRFFNLVHAQAVGGGRDAAKMFDSPYNDNFVTTPIYAGLSNSRSSNRAWYFERVDAYATAGGFDVAKMFDSPGDDIFHATPIDAALYRPGEFYYRAKHFEGAHAYATNGGMDTAHLFDSVGDDTFYSTPLYGALFGDGYYNRAKHFEKIYADAGAGGTDQALLHDSQSSDLLEADGNWARISNSTLDFVYEAVAFDSVKASASSSDNKKQVSDAALLDFVLELEGIWTDL